MANDPLNLDEHAEWAGNWWLPDDPDQQIPGVLRYEPEDGLVLSLIGAFEDRVMSALPGVTVVHEGTRRGTWSMVSPSTARLPFSIVTRAPSEPSVPE